jgi:hypothetical protein
VLALDYPARLSQDFIVEPTLEPLVLGSPKIYSRTTTFMEVHLNCRAPKGGIDLVIKSLDSAVRVALPGDPVPTQTSVDMIVPEGIDYELVRVQAQEVSEKTSVQIFAKTPTSIRPTEITVVP